MPKGIKTHALYLLLFIIIIIRIEIRTLAYGAASKDIMHETHAADSFGGKHLCRALGILGKG